MKTKSVNIQFTASADPERIIEAINNLTAWWATDVKGDSKKMNDTFTVRFGKTFSVIKVTEISNQKLVWQVIDCDLPLFENPKDWLSTKIVWELTRHDKQTLISMTHDGLTPDLSCYKDCKKGWTFYVKESLARLIVEGKGCPGTGIFSYIISGNRKYEGLLYFKTDPLPKYPDGFLYVDVKTTAGEQVTAAYAIAEYKMEKFNLALLNGEYFMVVENKPLHSTISPAQDIAATIII